MNPADNATAPIRLVRSFILLVACSPPSACRALASRAALASSAPIRVSVTTFSFRGERTRNFASAPFLSSDHNICV
jgi:uncharacterized protein (DUF302 family)